MGDYLRNSKFLVRFPLGAPTADERVNDKDSRISGLLLIASNLQREVEAIAADLEREWRRLRVVA